MTHYIPRSIGEVQVDNDGLPSSRDSLGALTLDHDLLKTSESARGQLLASLTAHELAAKHLDELKLPAESAPQMEMTRRLVKLRALQAVAHEAEADSPKKEPIVRMPLDDYPERGEATV